MSIATAKLTCHELVKSRNGSYPSLMAAAVNVLKLNFIIYVLIKTHSFNTCIAVVNPLSHKTPSDKTVYWKEKAQINVAKFFCAKTYNLLKTITDFYSLFLSIIDSC